MEIGTIKTLEGKKKKTKRRSSLQSGGSSGGNKNRGGGGGGGNNGGSGGDNSGEDLYRQADFLPQNKVRVGMWFLLLVVMMTFGGLISAYVVIATNRVLEWKPFDLPIQVWVSTVLIALSSATYAFGQNFLFKENQKQAKNWFLATSFLGGLFISSQILAWFELAGRGVRLESNQYAGFFYILTVVHALHVLGGICALGYILLRVWRETLSEKELSMRQSIAKTVGHYWHFMGGLWLLLFLLLGFWK